MSQSAATARKSPEVQHHSDTSSPLSADRIHQITNTSKGDAWQIMVSTSEDEVLHGKNDGDGVIRQLGGRYDKSTLLQLSNDMLCFGVPTTDSNGKSSRSYSPVVHVAAHEDEASAKFTRRYGLGHSETLHALNATPSPSLSKIGK
ncbi:hypothetical protein BBAD15_g5098 [Beauveria bassiana D1-5]|uniref:Uncharacterized protein n=1 Tax=Beauveria bassiana D1-5 TaxID=1245745 RepID=A0A0A2VNU3_BEABA|nr:hypothetical protein BBAD15_g5098 [Beauveria bassiana D1-5]